MLIQVRNGSEVPVTGYAAGSDFCRLFSEDMNGMYVLSLLLTADPAKAEQCFVSGLEDCIGANRVFKEWARSWARRTIVQNAIRVMKPAPERMGPLSMPAPTDIRTSNSTASLAAVLELPTFERFVFVMSVLERLSDQDCKALLGGSRHDIVRARNRSLKRVASSVPDVAVGAGRSFVPPRLMAETA